MGPEDTTTTETPPCTSTEADSTPERPATIVVRPLRAGDLRRVAGLLGRELDDGFLPRLGPRFRRRYLATFLDTPGSIGLVAEGQWGEPVAFVVGSTAAQHHRTALKLHWRRLLPAALTGLLIRPRLAINFLRTRGHRYALVTAALLRRRPQPNTPRPAAATCPAVLLHVAVEPQVRGLGTGTRLLHAFQQQARQAGCRDAVLVTFGGPNAFYENNGWEQSTTRTDDQGRTVVTYRCDL